MAHCDAVGWSRPHHQVRTTDEASGPDSSDPVTGLCAASLLDALGNLGKKRIARHDPAAVVDVDSQAIAADRAGKGHTASARRRDFGSDRCGAVEARMHPRPAKHRMVAAAEHRRKPGTRDRCDRALHGFAILEDDQWACGFRCREFQDTIRKLQSRLAEAWLARNAATRKLVFKPDQGKGRPSLKVTAEIDLPRQKVGQVKDPGQGQRGLGRNGGRDAGPVQNNLQAVAGSDRCQGL